jgi:hypothetical protein
MRYVRVRKEVAGFLVGSRYITHADGPFAVDDDLRARGLIAAGLAEACAPLGPDPVTAPAVERAEKPPTKAERATLRR